jgi:acetyl-CoA C-acetyltransferase
MSNDPTRIPVLVGLGQSIERSDLTSVVDLATRAAESAFDEAPGIRDHVQRVSLVGVSFSAVSLSAASEIADRLGLFRAAREASTPGGNTPQWLMNRACEEIVRGELEATLIVGAEATRSMRQSDPDYDFIAAAGDNRSGDEERADPIVGASVRGLLGRAELEASLIRPADVYPLFESTLAARSGASPEQQRKHIGKFMSRSSGAASKNRFAWFQEPRSAEEFSTVSAHNRLIAEPYTKYMNSFANVDQGSALLLTTLAIARQAGLADQCIFPWSGANLRDVIPAAREDLCSSPAIRAAAAASFELAGVGIDEIDVFDLYSCFPIAVEVGAAEIGLALDDSRGLTQTGGMAIFGGPGNNYTSHGIAAVALALRERGRLGYVSGNGGLLSKHSIGLYGSAPPPRGFGLADTSSVQGAIDAAALEVVFAAEGRARVEGGTVIYGRQGEVVGAPIVARLDDGRRVVAVAKQEILPSLTGRSLVGEAVTVSGASPPAYVA